MNVNNNLKVQHIKLYLRLKQQECIIGKSLDAFLVNSKVDLEFWHSIKNDIDKTEVIRHKIESSLKETVKNLYEELKGVKAMVNREKIKTIDLEAFKEKLQQLWKKIEEFKYTLNTNTDKYGGEQSSLETDLGALTRLIRKHKNFSSADSSYYKSLNLKAQSQKEDCLQECDYKEVEDFCTLLAKTGHTGGWSEEDHLLFVKLRKKHKSTVALVAALQAKCPDLGKESIVNHDAWYRTYLELREKQRLAVQEWRKRKEEERLARLAAAVEQPQRSGDKSEQLSRGSSCNEESHHLLKVAEHKKAEVERKKEKVRQWKEQRDKQRQAEEERLAEQLRARRQLKESKWQARANRVKELVAAEHRKQEELENNCLGHSGKDSNARPSAMSAFFLQLYRARDQEFLEKRRNSLLSKVNQNDLKLASEVRPVSCNLYQTGESTLFNETKAWKEKYKATADHKPIQTISYIKDLPKRALVSWRSYELPGPILYKQR